MNHLQRREELHKHNSKQKTKNFFYIYLKLYLNLFILSYYSLLNIISNYFYFLILLYFYGFA